MLYDLTATSICYGILSACSFTHLSVTCEWYRNVTSRCLKRWI